MMFKRGNDTSDESNMVFNGFKLKAAFITGGVGGTIASLAGVGGGGIMVPIMNLIFKQPFKKR